MNLPLNKRAKKGTKWNVRCPIMMTTGKKRRESEKECGEWGKKGTMERNEAFPWKFPEACGGVLKSLWPWSFSDQTLNTLPRHFVTSEDEQLKIQALAKEKVLYVLVDIWIFNVSRVHSFYLFVPASQNEQLEALAAWRNFGLHTLHLQTVACLLLLCLLPFCSSFLFYWDTRTDGTSPTHHARCKNKGRRGVAVAPATERFGTVAPATDSEFLGATSSLIAYLQNRINCGFIGSPVLTDSSGIQSDLIVKRWGYDTTDSGKHKAIGHGARWKHSPSQNQQQQVYESEGRAPTGRNTTVE